MSMLIEKVAIGELEGIIIGNGQQLIHQLFADDIGLFLMATDQNFRCARDVIIEYEKISRALLNVSKSIIIPLYLNGPIPN